MLFGLCNSPATFQRMMDVIFLPLKEKHRPLGTRILVYMDDILIASSALKGHRDAVHDVSVAPDALPTDPARNLLRKYLRLHLTRKAKS